MPASFANELSKKEVKKPVARELKKLRFDFDNDVSAYDYNYNEKKKFETKDYLKLIIRESTQRKWHGVNNGGPLTARF